MWFPPQEMKILTDYISKSVGLVSEHQPTKVMVRITCGRHCASVLHVSRGVSIHPSIPKPHGLHRRNLLIVQRNLFYGTSKLSSIEKHSLTCLENISTEEAPVWFSGSSSSSFCFETQPKGNTFSRGWTKHKCVPGLAHLSIRRLAGCWFQTTLFNGINLENGENPFPFLQKSWEVQFPTQHQPGHPFASSLFPRKRLFLYNLSKLFALLPLFHHQLLSGIKSAWKYFWFKALRVSPVYMNLHLGDFTRSEFQATHPKLKWILCHTPLCSDVTWSYQLRLPKDWHVRPSKALSQELFCSQL